MSERTGFGVGLLLTAALASWWLAATRLALLDPGGDPAALATRALLVAWACRALAILLLGPRLGAESGLREGAVAGSALVWSAWPLLALIGSAAAVSWPGLVLAEAALLVCAAIAAAIGAGLARWRPLAVGAPWLASLAGVLLAAAAWWAHQRGWPAGWMGGG